MSLQVRPWSSEYRSHCGEPASLPSGAVRNAVQNWYSRPRCGLRGELSTTSQFLSSLTSQVWLACTTTGAPKVRPPSVDRDTVTPLGQVVSKTSTDRYS